MHQARWTRTAGSSDIVKPHALAIVTRPSSIKEHKVFE